jgi:peptidoglycan/LPS O-acetylase OafA/YrhL
LLSGNVDLKGWVLIRLNYINQQSLSSQILDLLRFISALVVLLYHFHYNLPGYQAVMVFFVLSGYFISLSVMKTIPTGNWSWTEYLIKRVARLWIVLIPALILTYVWARIQIHFFGGSSYFSGVLDWKTFIGNLIFLQDIKVKQYGLNGPLWSLSYEFWYYVLFPCMMLIFYSKKVVMKLVYGLLFIAIGIFIGKQIMMYFLIWLLGAAIAKIKPYQFKNRFINMLIFIALVTIASLSTSGLYNLYPQNVNWKNPYFIPDLSVGVAFAILIYWIISMFNRYSYLGRNNIPRKLAGFSYTLYLVHYPLLYVWNAWTSSGFWKFDLNHTLYIKMVFVGLIVLYSYFLAEYTEVKTPFVTSWLLTLRKELNEKTRLSMPRS